MHAEFAIHGRFASISRPLGVSFAGFEAVVIIEMLDVAGDNFATLWLQQREPCVKQGKIA
ncbi:hypothetical protein [Collimonas humicola]|uniref:hypothetical protein n=1 Tax=Collimonas humicola TaxID=2825886 RepID=UPI001B8B8E72|nr:hypothetical protein [Collimonas humicola]